MYIHKVPNESKWSGEEPEIPISPISDETTKLSRRRRPGNLRWQLWPLWWLWDCVATSSPAVPASESEGTEGDVMKTWPLWDGDSKYPKNFHRNSIEPSQCNANWMWELPISQFQASKYDNLAASTHIQMDGATWDQGWSMCQRSEVVPGLWDPPGDASTSANSTQYYCIRFWPLAPQTGKLDVQ